MIRFEAILAAAVLLFDCREEDILGRSRTPRLVAARQAVMWAARQAGYGAMEIGRWMQRDHTTVLYGAAQAAGRAEHDPAYAQLLRQLAGLPEAPAVRTIPVRLAAPATGESWWCSRAYWWPDTTPAA